MTLRRFNDAGVEQFRSYLGALREGASAPPPRELIDDPRWTETVNPHVAVEQPPLLSKWDAGAYLRRTLSPIAPSKLRSDHGLWAWLAYCFFEQLCPADARGRRSPRENSKYIPRAGDHRYGLDKHLLFFPWKMALLHGESARCFLSDAIGKDTRALREWTGYNFNVCPPVVTLGARLYGDVESGSLRKGVTGSRRGNFRRFFRVLKQLEVTYDVRGMSSDQLLKLLPTKEFGHWLR